MSDRITLYYSPQTRATAVRVLLEELGAPYDLHVLNMKAGEQRQPAYLAINPMGKVPAIGDGDSLVTEQVAIFIHLADRFPKAGLAPAIGDPLRGPYLRWIAFYGSCMEPAITDRAMKRDPSSPSQSGYGDYDSVVRTVYDQIGKGPWILGARFSAGDILWGTALRWLTMFKLLPETPAVLDYVKRVTSRPAFQMVSASDMQMAAEHEKAAAKGG